jgi:hypothetical protein
MYVLPRACYSRSVIMNGYVLGKLMLEVRFVAGIFTFYASMLMSTRFISAYTNGSKWRTSK